jgi:hypothetical protein
MRVVGVGIETADIRLDVGELADAVPVDQGEEVTRCPGSVNRITFELRIQA